MQSQRLPQCSHHLIWRGCGIDTGSDLAQGCHQGIGSKQFIRLVFQRCGRLFIMALISEQPAQHRNAFLWILRKHKTDRYREYGVIASAKNFKVPIRHLFKFSVCQSIDLSTKFAPTGLSNENRQGFPYQLFM